MTATERFAREDVTVAGTTIPLGFLVYAVLASVNRDELRWRHGLVLRGLAALPLSYGSS